MPSDTGCRLQSRRWVDEHHSLEAGTRPLVRQCDKGGRTGALCLICGGRSRSACELARGRAWTTHTGFDVIYVWVDKIAGPRAVIHGMIANRGVNGDPITQCGAAAEIQVVGEHQHHGLHRVSAPVDCSRGEPAY